MEQEAATMYLLLSLFDVTRRDSDDDRDDDATEAVNALNERQRHTLLKRGFIASAGTGVAHGDDEMGIPDETYAMWSITPKGRALVAAVLRDAAKNIAMRIALDDVE